MIYNLAYSFTKFVTLHFSRKKCRAIIVLNHTTIENQHGKGKQNLSKMDQKFTPGCGGNNLQARKD